ncbi:hypothetical protein HK097_009677 [Rhizophlyctis rosea]|uniref:Glutamyl-tRNA synthetase n=1 Tax=Rhizophlyctis rosea TaxID=64517 RepID=A0AAD5X098_9FUNG|nr:hypothetical protein HK097_009677 [Rhizophlyctis rosea]
MSFTESPRYKAALEAFHSAHLEDPTSVPSPTDPTTTIPYSAIYHTRLTHYVNLLSLPSTPSEPLLLSASSQHIRRWTIPRSSYPTGLPGYKRWRASLSKFHADTAESILRSSGYASPSSPTPEEDELLIKRVRDLLLKRNLSDPEIQLFEDCVCLVFLEKEFDAFAEKLSEEKLIDVVKKTWNKMGEKGHQAALELVGKMAQGSRDVILKALTEESPAPPAAGDGVGPA